MYVDRHGQEMQQVTAFITVDQYRLVRADRLNLSQFLRDQLDVLYGEESAHDSLDRKARLIQAARESSARQKAIADETAEARERLRAVAQELRTARMAEREQQQAAESAAESRAVGIRNAVDAIIGDDPIDRYWRVLPENDIHGDFIDTFDALRAGVSRRCGGTVDSAEVIAEIRRRAARGLAREER